MKPHLPIALLSLLSVASLAQAVEIPDNYELVELHSTSVLYLYTSNTEDDKYAYILDSDLEFSPSPVINGGNHIFYTEESVAPVEISFTNGTNTSFVQPSSLTFDSFSRLNISNYKGASNGGVINLNSGSLNIRNIKDGNHDTNDVELKDNEIKMADSSYGGAIYSKGTKSHIVVEECGEILISSNHSISNSTTRASSYGGGIYASSYGGGIYGTIDITNNEKVHFNNNWANAVTEYFAYSSASGSAHSYGGAIYSGRNIKINNNEGGVIFSQNAARADSSVQTAASYVESGTNSTASAFGGAIYCSQNLDIDNNESVSFSANNAYSLSHAAKGATAIARGGAIYSSSNTTINNCKEGIISITGNYAYSYSRPGSSKAYQTTSAATSDGGFIYSTGNFIINNNNSVYFSGNSARATADTLTAYSADVESVARGGVIYSTGNVIISNNADIVFSKNYVSASSTASALADHPDLQTTESVKGGGIYSTGNISVIGNTNVTFEKNYEKVAKSFRLRSIYLNADAASDTLELAAKSGGNINFFDSVYMANYAGSTVSLNADYEDANGVTQKATGDIVFSGKYTEKHLKEVKGSAGTSTEIANSRTSELLNTVNLYGGTLRVEDKAVLKTHAINVAADGNATMKVLDAEVNASTYDVTINSTGQLTLGGTDGSAKLTAKNININTGATLAVERIEPVDPSSVITLAASETVSIFNEKLGGVASGNLNLAAGSSYKADGAHLGVINGTLTFNATDGEKINLILTLGAEYNKDSQVILFTDVTTVNFVWDDIIASDVSDVITLNASDYFTGDWINENTSLIYDSGTIYVTGVNRVIPEPTTATLSLLALTAMAARRRRK